MPRNRAGDMLNVTVYWDRANEELRVWTVLEGVCYGHIKLNRPVGTTAEDAKAIHRAVELEIASWLF